MKLRDLQYLVAVDDERHFHRAAARCFVSQPTLSGQLKKLEQELDVVLVERNTRQVIMTQVGHAVAEQARKVMLEVKRVEEIAAAYHDPMAGDMHMGLIPTVAPYLLPLIMPALNRHYPQLRLWLHEQQTSVLLDKLKKAELDLAVLALPVENREFEQLFLFAESFRLAVSKQQELAKHTSINMDDLKQHKMLLLEEGHCLRGQALAICYKAGAEENIGFHATSLEILRHMVGENMGITLMPELAVPVKQHKNDTVRYLTFADPAPSRRIGLLYRKTSHRQPAFVQIKEMIQSSLAELKNNLLVSA